MTPEQIRAELSRRAAGIVPRVAFWIEGLDPPDGEALDFCETCADERGGGEEVRRDFYTDSDILRWCDGCSALLEYRIGQEEAEEAVAHFEAEPPTEPKHWAELLLAMAEVPPEDWRTPSDPPVEPSPLWMRVQALLGAVGSVP